MGKATFFPKLSICENAYNKMTVFFHIQEEFLVKISRQSHFYRLSIRWDSFARELHFSWQRKSFSFPQRFLQEFLHQYFLDTQKNLFQKIYWIASNLKIKFWN